jgi:uncharacterized membrane protein YkoI
MQTGIRWLILALGLAGLAAGCASVQGKADKEGNSGVSLTQLSGPARETVKRLTAGGQIEKIDREVEKGKVIYDVEASVGGKHVEYSIADADGAVLGTETEIEISQLPEPVRAATEKYFGTTTGLKAVKGLEDGKTSYEIEGKKNGKKMEVTFDPTGKRIE